MIRASAAGRDDEAPLHPIREDVVDQIAVEWLPADVKQGIYSQDAQRFENLVVAFEKVAAKVPNTEAFHVHRHAVVDAEELLTQVQGFFRTHRMIDLRAVQRLYNATFQLALTAETDWDVHYQWLAAGTSVLSSYANELRMAGMQLDWSVYWNLLERKRKLAASSTADSNVSLSLYKEAYTHCKKARSLFPPEAVEPIWQKVHAQLKHTLSPISLQALIQLLTFFPFKAAPAAPELPLHDIAAEAVQLWLSVNMNTFWDRLWLRFLARLAKWDTHARVDWQRLLRPVCTYAMHLLRVPLQGTPSAAATVITPPDLPSASIIDRVCSSERSCAEHLGKLLVQAVSAAAPAAATTLEGLPPVAALQQFTLLLDHYYHAPNAGKWSKGLAEYLDACVEQLTAHRLPFESTSYWRGAPERRKLDMAAARRIAEALWPLAKLAVFHKDSSLQAVGLDSVAALAVVLPERALPFAVRTFTETLASAEAVHQIETTISLLSECVRPMLLHGLPLDPESPDTAPGATTDNKAAQHARAAAAVGSALEALLPAVDANDDGKLRVTLAFFNSVFCSVVALRSDNPAGGAAALGGVGEAGGGLPVGMDLRYWAVELVERLVEVARMLQGHEGAAGGTDDGEGGTTAATWLGRHCIFTLFAAQFFQKLPADAGRAAFERVCRLAPELQDAAAVRAVGQLVLRGCAAHPAAASAALLRPLLQQLEEHAAAQPGKDVNASHVTWLCAKCTLLVYVIQGLGEAGQLEEHAERVLDVVLKISLTSSPAVNDSSSSMLACLLVELTGTRLRLDAVPHTALQGRPGVAAWLQCRGGAAAQPCWRAPRPSEHAAAAAVARRAAAAAAGGLSLLTAEGRLGSAEPAARQAVHRSLVLAFAVLEGLLSVADPPLLSDEAAAARASDAEHALAVHHPPVSAPWKECAFYGEAVDLALVVLEKASESGTTNATVALSLIELSAPVTHLSDLSTESPGYELVREDAYRGFYEPPTADALRGAPTASAGTGFRSAPAAVAARTATLLHARRYYAFAGVAATVAHPCVRAHELAPRLRGAAASVAKAVRHRYPGVSVDAVEVFQGALAALCSQLADGAMPGVVAALGLLEGGRGGWVLSTDDGVDEKLQAASEELLGVLGTDWRRQPTPAAADGEEPAPAPGAQSDTPTPACSTPPASPHSAGVDMTAVPTPVATPPLETSASDMTADLATRQGDAAAAERPLRAAAAALGPASPTAADASPADAPPVHGGPPAAEAGPEAVQSQVRRSLRRLSLPQTGQVAAADAGGAALRGHRVPQTLGSGDAGGGDVWEEELLAEASVDAVAAQADVAEAGAQVCTEANQHIVAGAIDFLEQSRATLLPALLRRRPQVARALLLVMSVALRYDTRDVKTMVSATLPIIVQLLERRVGDAPGTFLNAALFGDTAALLCRRMLRDRLHWREALVAHVLCLHLVPLCPEPPRLEQLLAAQAYGLFQGSSLLCKNAAMMALVDAGFRASAAGAPDALPPACRSAVAACGAAGTDFGETLLATLVAIKGANFDQMILSAMSEATMVAGTSGITIDTVCDSDLGLFTLVPPSVDASQGGGDGDGAPGESIRMTLVHFVAFLVQFDAAGDAAVAPQLRTRLDAWAAAPQKDRMADGSTEKLLEVAVIECCLGVLLGALRRDPASLDVPSSPVSGDPKVEDLSHGVKWVLGLMSRGYAAAPTEKGNVWAYAFAVSARIAANTSLKHAAEGNVGAYAAATSALTAVMRTLRTLVDTWSGSTSTDIRHVCALAYIIDELLQASAACMVGAAEPREPCCEGGFSQHGTQAGTERLLRSSGGAQAALAEAVQLAVDTIPRAATHALQSVRAAGAQMAASAALALGDACLPPSARDTSDPASLASRLRAALAARLDAADAALPAACAADAAAATPAATAPAGDAARLERAIGFAAALANACRRVHLGAPALLSLQLRLVPWALAAQAVTHPDLQPLMGDVRRARKLPPLSVDAARTLLPQVVQAAQHAHWQVRITAVQTLQPLWYRHNFAFSTEHVDMLITAAAERLRDSKTEVRGAARRLLAGLLQCAAPATTAAFRAHAHAEFAAAFPVRSGSRKRRRGDAAAPALAAPSVTEQHACTLALSAVCASQPYAIAEWTGELIVALARAAQAPAPVKTAALEALAEFRKNQEGTSRQPLRERLAPAVWDALRDSALQSSYFA
eukprot:jgi/Ulvmu1/8846/UM049_0027.1